MPPTRSTSAIAIKQRLRIAASVQPANVLWPNFESDPSLRICHSQTDWNLLKMHNLIPNGGFK